MQDDTIRASDADRDAVVERLHTHTAAGRLSQQEFEARMTTALAATTRGELAALLTDLPADRPWAAPGAAYPAATVERPAGATSAPAVSSAGGQVGWRRVPAGVRCLVGTLVVVLLGAVVGAVGGEAAGGLVWVAAAAVVCALTKAGRRPSTNRRPTRPDQARSSGRD